MARQGAIAIENNFVSGLITETTALKFPPNACTETDNCVFDETGRVTRRLGIDIEEGAGTTIIVPVSTDVYTEFVWTTVGGDGNTSFLVQQQANFLFFYDISTSLTPSANPKLFSVDLDDYAVPASSRDPATEQCQYTINTGNLLVVNPGCNPIYISYDSVADDITTTEITLKQRDFSGVDDGMTLSQRPAVNLATLISDEPEHYYNILNQGWYAGSSGTAGGDTGSILNQWDAARTDLPSNADTVGLFRSNATDGFDNAIVQNRSPGNRPAPKGHFILDVANLDRNQAATDEGFPLTLGLTASFIAGTNGSYIGNIDPSSPIFDNTINGTTGTPQVGSFNGTSAYAGKNYSASPKRITKAIVYGSQNLGFTNSVPAMNLKLYGKVGSAPANATDGTLLGTTSFNDTDNESLGRTVLSSDTDTFYDYVWIRLARDDNASTDFFLAEIQFFQVAVEGAAIPSTTERPSTIASFAGRVWYAGLNGLGYNSSLFFTQIIEKPDQYEQCYQKNDPTSEDFSDLLPDDGGVIKIPEIGRIIKLFGFQTSLVVLATNGVWIISGSSGSGFAANDYIVRKLSSIGTDSPLSVVDYKGLPIWWGDDGINTIKFDPNYDSFSVISATDQSIKSFILDIPGLNRRFVKGCFDVNTEAVYWIFNDTASLTSSDYYIYNRALLLNGLSKAFYPWSIVTGGSTPDIRGIAYCQEGSRIDDPVVKLTVTDGTSLTYADVRDTAYVDWGTEDYSSYFITGYRIDGQTQKFFQPNYVMVLMDELEDSSCYMQGVFDFTTSDTTGKWGTLQQIYNTTHPNRSIRMRRLKVRGKGRALQLRFESDTGKPFSIIGWSLWETTNSDI